MDEHKTLAEQQAPNRWRKLFGDPLVWLTLVGFGLPFILQLSFYPFQKLSMFSEDPSAYRDMPTRILKK